ncbi:MmgE/PrpD family protein [Sporosarcina sp. 179-K 3D1 HS]|uniref:MmgE/PrpD family protein n=1 Tax=Sporosarcina sp. 179-K 3D1 HS TaxID=3232169 RepID=UPI0039A024DD
MSTNQLLKKGYTEELASFVFEFHDRELSLQELTQVKRVIIDYYCAAITGSTSATSQTILNYLIENEGEGKTNVIGSSIKLSKTNAAFINGTSAHALDFDDGHTVGSTHPGSVVLPAVFAVSETIKADPSKIIKAIVVGYEIGLRIAAAIHPVSRKKGFHNTPVAGIFGAAAAVSYLYDSDIRQIRNAFGIAGSLCGGTFAFLGSGSEVKRIHPGQAAQDGIKAAELAIAGLTGPETVFETENGIFMTFADNQINPEILCKSLDAPLEIMNIYFKPYPCCRHLHVAIDCIMNIKERGMLDLSTIQKIKVGVNQIAALHGHKHCTNLLDAQMSLPYSIAVALLNNSLQVNHFKPENAGEQVWELCDKIEIYVDEEADKNYPQKRAAKVEIIMDDGRTIKEVLDNPLGEPTRPLSDRQIEAKFYDNCAPIIGEEKAEKFIENMKSFQNDLDFLYEI